jgi:hypothetical protein
LEGGQSWLQPPFLLGGQSRLRAELPALQLQTDPLPDDATAALVCLIALRLKIADKVLHAERYIV